LSAAWLTVRDLCARLRVSRPTLWAWRRRGAFPAPVVLPGGQLRWDSRDVEKWERALPRGRAA
jgi:excisionase family DNA binding protein